MSIDKKEALASLIYIVEKHKDYMEFASGLKSKGAADRKRSLASVVLRSCSIGDLNVLTLAYQAGGDLEARDTLGHTPAHRAASNDWLDCLKFLAEKKINLEARNFTQHTPAHEAAFHNSLGCLRFLAEQNVDIKATDSEGRTLAHMTAYQNSLACLRFLAEQKVDLETKNNNGNSPVNLAEMLGNHDIVDFFKDFVAKNKHIDPTA